MGKRRERDLLELSTGVLGRWRESFNDALGPNGQLIVNLVPELELVIGKQPAVADLPLQLIDDRRFADAGIAGVTVTTTSPTVAVMT